MPAKALAAEAVQREVRIDAPPSAVFGFLTQPEKMVRWMGVEATLDPRPGGIYRVDLTGDERVSGRVSGHSYRGSPKCLSRKPLFGESSRA